MTAVAPHKTSELRDQMIMDHLSQVRLIARRIRERCPDNVVLEDLISAGTIGLISAIDRFDPTQGVKLKTYAEYKIRGAILDSLRSMDWAPREQRRRAKLVEVTISTLEQKLHRVATELEIAQELGITIADYHEWLVEIRGVNMGSLEVAVSSSEDSRDLLQYISGDQDNLPSALLERSELERLVATAVERMPYTERTVLNLYFREELTLREIAKVVGLHESRISQLKAQALLRLRAYLQKCWPEKGSVQKTVA
ncbi:MAG: FliA/WhiG family RNA polymerase sigma factor [Bryobacteraceae bacterium]|nr:FliA/WhiG family RNA polymerase sigma factor [Bryobacteraceae bacterium]